jgi:hypothetical protein
VPAGGKFPPRQNCSNKRRSPPLSAQIAAMRLCLARQPASSNSRRPCYHFSFSLLNFTLHPLITLRTLVQLPSVVNPLLHIVETVFVSPPNQQQCTLPPPCIIQYPLASKTHFQGPQAYHLHLIASEEDKSTALGNILAFEHLLPTSQLPTICWTRACFVFALFLVSGWPIYYAREALCRCLKLKVSKDLVGLRDELRI